MMRVTSENLLCLLPVGGSPTVDNHMLGSKEHRKRSRSESTDKATTLCQLHNMVDKKRDLRNVVAASG